MREHIVLFDSNHVDSYTPQFM